MDGMESRWYLAPGQTLENTNISDLQHALHVTRPAWNKINAHLDRNRIIAETLEKERAYKQAMKEGSEAMTKNWPDTIERAHNRKVEERKQNAKAQEQEKIEKYMELTKEQEDLRQAYIEKVKRSMYYSKAFPKMLNGALLESEAIYERQKQIEFKEKLKQHELEKEMKWAEQVKRAAEDEKLENLEKARHDLKKKEEFKEINMRDMMERRETMRIQKERYKEKRMADNLNLMKEIELQERIKQEDRRKIRETRRKELLEYIAKDNAIKAHILKEEAEVEEVIKIFAEAKDNIACLRKEKDKEIQLEAIRRREVAGLEVKAIQEAKDEVFFKNIQEAQEAAERKEEEKRLKRIEKENQMRKEREDDRREHLEREAKAKAKEDELRRWELLNRQKQESVTKEYLEDKRQEEWQKTLQYRQELLEQIDERKTREKEEAEEEAKTEDNIVAEREDKKFFAYADSLVDYCKAKGRPTYPIYKVVDNYKKTNLLTEKKDTKCEDYYNQLEKRREKLANNTPGKMSHYPRTDPNYKRCKCQKERILR